jgi:hypothetical protein
MEHTTEAPNLKVTRLAEADLSKKTASGSSASWYLPGPLGRAPVVVVRNQKVDAYQNTGISKPNQLPSTEGRRVELDFYLTGSNKNDTTGHEQRVPVSATIAFQAPCTEAMGEKDDINQTFQILFSALFGLISDGTTYCQYYDMLQGKTDITDFCV